MWTSPSAGRECRRRRSVPRPPRIYEFCLNSAAGDCSRAALGEHAILRAEREIFQTRFKTPQHFESGREVEVKRRRHDIEAGVLHQSLALEVGQWLGVAIERDSSHHDARARV